MLVDKSGYVGLSAFPTIIESEDVRMDVRLVKSGAGSISGIILDSADKSPIAGVTLNIRSGWFMKNTNIKATTTTDSNGLYTFDLGDKGAGYYTIEMLKDGYKISTFNVTVSGTTTGQDAYLEKNISVITDVPIGSWVKRVVMYKSLMIYQNKLKSISL